MTRARIEHLLERRTVELQEMSARLAREVAERRSAEDALQRRLGALTEPIDVADVLFEDLFDVEEIQRVQDAFAEATKIASLITRPDGTPVTKPSRFCRLCIDTIRKTTKGLANCYHSDAIIGTQNPRGPTIQRCLSSGLWDAGASITVGGRHVANWLIGQVKNEEVDESKLMAYASDIGANADQFRDALREVPVMSTGQFTRIAEFLFLLANELSLKAYQNVQQARFIAQERRTEEALRLDESRLEALLTLNQMAESSIREITDFCLEEGVRLTKSKIGYLAFMNEDETVLTLHSWSRAAMAASRVPEALVHPVATTGPWGDAVRQRRPIITNDCRGVTKGTPLGHTPIHRHMNVPVFEGDRIVAVTGVGNKDEPYDESDVRQLTLLSQGMWRLVQRRRMEDALKDHGHRLEEVVRERTAALEEANVLLRQQDRRKTEFLAMLGHELRNPLTPIRNAAHLMRRSHPAGCEQAVAIVERQVAQMTRLVDALLDISRLTHGRLLLEPEPLELGAVVRAALDDHVEALHARGVTAELQLPDQQLPVRGDRTRLAQVLGNLLNNAEKFTSRGGRVSVRAETHGDRVAVSVADTGMGMSEETRCGLFQPFGRSKASLERGGGGLGLGLSLVKSLVEAHGGTVQASSAGVGLGSEFVIDLPLEPQPKQARPGPVHPSAAPPPASRRIVVIEDNVDAADTLRLMLEMAGHEVSVVASGEEGAAQAARLRPDVVLSDIGLPGRMNGHDVAQALRRDPSLRSTRLIALSGFDQEEDRRRALEAGFDHYVVKPFDYDDLEPMLQ